MNSLPIAIAAPSPHSLGAFLFDEADEFFWDRASGRYRYKSGAGKGQFAPREAVLTLTRKNLELRSQELVALGDRLSSGEITTRQFQSQAGALLKRIHLQSAILGSGGVDKMSSADFLRVARTLKTQYYAGKDEETGKRYGLKHLTQELLEGKVSEAQLKARLKLYAQSGNLSYWAAVVKAEKGSKPFGIRSLGVAEHCPDCEAYAKMRPRPLDELPLPGTRCQCRANCKCSIVPLTLEQAVARGMTADYGVVRDKLGRFASKHGAGAAAAAVSWKVGKVVGGAVGAIAAQHGFNPELSRVVGESVVQAFTATALHASKGNREPKDLAQKFLSEAAAAFAGKTLPGFDDAIAGGDDDVKEIVATFAGRALNSPRATAFMAKHGKRLKSALSRQSSQSFAEHDFTRDELESMWALAVAAMVVGGHRSEYEFGSKPKSLSTKKRNCTPGKSHFCRREGGLGTCLPMSKKCRYAPPVSAIATATSDYLADKSAGKLMSSAGASPSAASMSDRAVFLDNNTAFNNIPTADIGQQSQEMIAYGKRQLSKRQHKELDAATKMINEQVEPLRQELNEIYRQLWAPPGTTSAVYQTPEGQEYTRRYAELLKLENEASRRLDSVMGDVRDKMLARTSKEEATAWVDKNIKVMKSATKDFSEAEIKEVIAEFWRLSNQSPLWSVRKIKQTSARAFADPGNYALNVGKNKDVDGLRATLFHELGHHLESSAGKGKRPELIAASFLQSRRTGVVQPLNDIVGSKLYDGNEYAVPDKFVNPYVGKIYGRGQTEVISMGLEHFSSPTAMGKLFRSDPDHFWLIMGLTH